jgi:type IV pilus assembly protein PilQ
VKVLVLAAGLVLSVLSTQEGRETLIDLDVTSTDVTDVLRLLAEVGSFNLVADPGIQCQLTLKLKAVTWPDVLAVVLRSCKLGQERMGENLVRVARLEQLRQELAEKRRYEEQKALAGPLRTTYRRLAYARAREIAPLLEKFLSPRGEVVFDDRTNTLIITDVGR